MIEPNRNRTEQRGGNRLAEHTHAHTTQQKLPKLKKNLNPWCTACSPSSGPMNSKTSLPCDSSVETEKATRWVEPGSSELRTPLSRRTSDGNARRNHKHTRHQSILQANGSTKKFLRKWSQLHRNEIFQILLPLRRKQHQLNQNKTKP